MYDLNLPIKYDVKKHTYVATEDFEIPYRVINDEISEVLKTAKLMVNNLIEHNPAIKGELEALLSDFAKIEKLNSEKMTLIEK